MRKLSIVLAGASAVAGLALTAGTAGASTVHTESANPCGTTWCAAVNARGVHVVAAKITLRSRKQFKGYPYVEAIAPHHKITWIWKARITKTVGSKTITINRKFASKTMLCIGVAPTKSRIDHVGDACMILHA
ncbi:hypothetical protein NE236_08335 [Actinoallomurus purpureus]|uniref:hypothetical protein n=1 Tax=Actinoallomurus purpureus TaxID=478114 RepID=UPI0020939CFB|nr:hypothetical protein [Actinoallomurus purpureus]MCO6004987.1 hypothetical protein [Actinoallomurus purpureus]